MKHIPHVEDVFYEHQWTPYNVLMATYQTMLGAGTCSIMTKYDGSPSVVFGTHPKNNRFFVATKSAWNKTGPILSFTKKDCETNYGHDPNLLEKMLHCYEYLKKVTIYGIWQGDLLYYPGALKVSDTISFTANTITYSAIPGSEHERKMRHSSFGIYVHTSFKGNCWEDLTPNYTPIVDSLQDHSEVHIIKPRYVRNCTDLMEEADHERFWFNLESTVRMFQTKYDMPRTKKELAEVKKKLSKCIQNEFISGNNAIDIPVFYYVAKQVLMGVLNRDQQFHHTIDGQTTAPEGYVVIYQGKPYKLVDQREFTQSNNRKRNR